MIGFAASPGTEVLPMWCTATSASPSRDRSFSASRWNSAGHSGECSVNVYRLGIAPRAAIIAGRAALRQPSKRRLHPHPVAVDAPRVAHGIEAAADPGRGQRQLDLARARVLLPQ